MKYNVRTILNEARVQRTIDSKIWASMSSMTSRLRASLGQDAKPMKKDDLNTLLQKYVAGLLTMKVDCPNNVSEIDDIKAYRLIGNEYIKNGGTISAIQKLYVENGGKLKPGTTIEEEPVNIDMDDIDDEYDDQVAPEDTPEDTPTGDEYDEITNRVISNGIADMEDDTEETDYPSYDEVPDEDIAAETKMKLANTQQYINAYLKRNKDILAAPMGSFLDFNENTGEFDIIKNSDKLLPVSTRRGYLNVDKKTRFMVISNNEYELGNAGNNSVYDDYYFKKTYNNKGELVIQPGSNYYEDFATKGKFFTEILAENGMVPAMHVQEVVSECDITNPDALEVLKVSCYLPTLQELADASKLLPVGTYWTSSVTDKGRINIAFHVNPDKVLATCKSARIAAFIKFD